MPVPTQVFYRLDALPAAIYAVIGVDDILLPRIFLASKITYRMSDLDQVSHSTVPLSSVACVFAVFWWPGCAVPVSTASRVLLC